MKFDTSASNVSEQKKKALNIFGVVLLVAVNTLINLVLTPFVTENLGVEANGYITLANNFITYFALITTAFNSMSGRFILVARRQGKEEEAAEYYSSNYFGNLIISAMLAVPAALVVLLLPSIISIDGVSAHDVQILFGITFLNFFAGFIVPQWDCATYVTNSLYLRSLKNALAGVIRALSIMLLFWCFSPRVQFVAMGGLVACVMGLAISFGLKRMLLPDLRVSRRGFRVAKVRELSGSGVWNSVSQCGNLLLEGLDLLIANIFLGATVSGVLSIAKIVPNMVNQIVGNIATTFGPSVTGLYAEGDMDGIVSGVCKDMAIVSMFASIPSGVAIAYGADFFTLWVPSQDAGFLAALMALTIVGVYIAGVAKCVVNVFGAMNRLRIISIATIISGVVNMLVVLFLLSWTNLGVYAIAGVSSVIALIREFCFTLPYAARQLQKPYTVFIGSMFRACIVLAVCTAASCVVASFVPGDTWLSFFIGVVVAAMVCLILEIVLFRSCAKGVLRKNE